MEQVDPPGRVTPEVDPRVVPRVYVASLSDYNDGRLYGRWIDAGQEAAAIYEQVEDMLRRSPTPLAEEWAIHDYEGFGPLRLSEYESFETVARIAQGIAEHGEAFAHWAACVGSTEAEELDHFDDAFLGTWGSAKEYAESLVDELGIEDALDKANLPFRGYIHVDVDMLARDLETEYHFSEGTSGVHVFAC